MERGCFIVFEGLDGSGTSTHARALHEKMLRGGLRTVLTSEPTNGPVGGLIRLAMGHRLEFAGHNAHDDRQLAYLFAADRYDHLHNSKDGVLELLARGIHVISTRYYLSSYAYHCNSEGDFEAITRLNADFPEADVTFYVETPVDLCLARIHRSRALAEKYETREKLLVVAENYRYAISKLQIPVIQIDGTRPYPEVSDSIYTIVQRRLSNADTDA